MKSKTREPMCNLHLYQWWAWIPLVTLLAGGCDGCKAPGPRERVCEPIAYYEVLNSEQGAGKAPFSIERLGPELKSEQVQRKPDFLSFPRKDRVTAGWDMGGIFIPRPISSTRPARDSRGMSRIQMRSVQ